MTYDAILAALCTNWELKSSSDFQKVYAIDDAKEAKLAFDVLRSFGIETKVYDDGVSKLYVTNPDIPENDLAAKLAQALAYATVLAPIKREMDRFSTSSPAIQNPDYSIAFANSGAGKQIVISVAGAASATVAATPGVSAPQQQRPKQAASAPTSLKSNKYTRGKEEESLHSAGPQLLRDNNKIITKKDREKQESDSYWRQLSLYVKGNSAVAAVIIIMVIIALFSVFSMFIVSKGFLCPDLAHRQKNVPWYCKPIGGEEEKEQDPNALPEFSTQ